MYAVWKSNELIPNKWPFLKGVIFSKPPRPIILGIQPLVFGSVKFTIFLESNHRQVDDEATAQWLRWQRALRLAEPTVGVGLPGQSAGPRVGVVDIFKSFVLYNT